MSRSRTRARLRVGEYLGDPSRGYRVEGVIVYREWDPEDQHFDYWEEWELAGYGLQDTWIEVDHYLDEIVVYEPVLIDEPIDARALTVGQTLPLRSGGAELMGVVTETGAGEVEEAAAYSHAPAPVGEPLAYATIHVTPRPGFPPPAAPPAPGYSAAPRPIALTDGQGMDVTVETSGWQPVRAYRRRPISEAEQTQLLGKVVYKPRRRRPGRMAGGAAAGAAATAGAAAAAFPGSGGRSRARSQSARRPARPKLGDPKTWYLILALVLLIVQFYDLVSSCRSSDDCDPRTERCTSSTGTRYRPVYGGGGSGGGK